MKICYGQCYNNIGVAIILVAWACKLSISSGEQSEPPSWSRAIILGTTMRHLHISHNAPYLPPQILHNLCFSFLQGITAFLREIENNAYANFEGQIRCIMGDVQVAYS